MFHFGVTMPSTVPQRSEIPEGFMNYPVYDNLKRTQKPSSSNLCFQQFDKKYVNKVIFVTAICVTAKPTVIMVVFLRYLMERVHSAHITYILPPTNHFDSEDGACKFPQNFVKTFHCQTVPKSSRELPCEKQITVSV